MLIALPLIYHDNSSSALQTPRFLAALKDDDLAVRRAALLTVNTMIRNKPAFVLGTLTCMPLTSTQPYCHLAESLGGDPSTNLLGVIYGETKVKPELVRTVQVGPFKHKVDDGLELRMAAFECLDTVLDTCIEKVHLQSHPHPWVCSHRLPWQVESISFLAALATFNDQNKAIGGLTDEIDVKMICQLLLIKCADVFPAAVSALSGTTSLFAHLDPIRMKVTANMDAICAAFMDTIKTKPKANDVPTEVQRNEDCLKSVFRVVVTATDHHQECTMLTWWWCQVKLQMLDADSQRLKELIQSIEGDERVKGKFAAVVEEAQQNE